MKAIGLSRLLGHICRTLNGIAIAALFVMVITIALQVFSRNLMDTGLPWADELARFCGIILVFMAAPKLLLHRQHIAVDLFSARMSATTRRIVAGLQALLTVIFCIIVCYAIFRFLERAAHFATPAMNMPNWLFYAPALIGFMALLAVGLFQVIRGSHESGMLQGEDAS